MRLSDVAEQGYTMLHEKYQVKERTMPTNTNLLIAFLLCMVLCISPVSGKVLKVPSEHPTIDVAVGIASDGDTILIARGTYEHTTLNVNKRLTLASNYMNTKDQSDIDEIIIKATAAAEKQWFALNSKDSRIIGLTIGGNKNHTLKITSPYSEVLYCNFIGGGDQLSFEGGGGRVAHCNFDGAGDDVIAVEMNFDLKVSVQAGEGNKKWLAFNYGPHALAQKITTIPDEEPFWGMNEKETSRMLKMLSKSSDSDIAFSIKGTDITLLPYYMACTEQSGPRTYFRL
jgi:hypothetical protein